MAMPPVAYWIQRADFSASDHEAADSQDALRVLRNHDWREEWRLQAEREAAGREHCPPGIGFTARDGPILHVCPMVSGKSMVHFHPARRKFLDFVRRPGTTVHTKRDVEEAEIVELIQWFFAERHDWILRKLVSG
jgi:hypothetical protein